MSEIVRARRPRSSRDIVDRSLLAASAMVTETATAPAGDFERWWEEMRSDTELAVERVPFADLRNWKFDAETGNLGHDSGRFFTVQGLQVTTEQPPVPHWTQPIINQSEVGILGLVVRDFDGVLHCLVQAKVEPGNINVVQVSPTVQATQSNYTRVHGGLPVPYLEYFTAPDKARVLVDALQSEQGSWFYRKRNRNMVVEVTETVPVRHGYRWITLGLLRRIAAVDNLMNMDLRTVFACIPFDRSAEVLEGRVEDDFRLAVARSLSPRTGALHTRIEVMRWFNDIKIRNSIAAQLLPLREVRGWRRTEGDIAHESGKYFSVIAAAVRSSRREVREWTQPFLAPVGIGVIAFLVCGFAGGLHVLVHARIEPGYLDIVELAPTVQCTPENYADWPDRYRPPFLDAVLEAEPGQIRYDAIQSEEGGRFFQAQNRYLIIEVDQDLDVPPDYLWMTVGQLTGLLEHGHYLNVQARSLIACLNSVW